MSEELGRLLGAAFDAGARAAVPDEAAPPPPRFATDSVPGRSCRAGAAMPMLSVSVLAPVSRRHGRARLLAPVAAAAAVVAIGASVVALRDGSPHGRSAGATAPAATSSTARTVAPPVPQRGSGKPVRIAFATADGARYGVGMPVVAFFSRTFTDASALSAATSISVDGVPARGAWFFERSTARRGFPVEGHLRLPTYWPAHAHVAVALASAGVTAGTGLVFADSARVGFSTGPRTVVVVNAHDHRLTVTRDGAVLRTYPVSLGAAATPTSGGTKVIMSKAPSVCMHDAAHTYDECGIKFAQRLTSSGEYLNAAPWNVRDIAAGVDSSNGCTNLRPADAQRLYADLEVGDVVLYPNAGGPQMRLGEGYGDWNVAWSTWSTGGLVPTHRR